MTAPHCATAVTSSSSRTRVSVATVATTEPGSAASASCSNTGNSSAWISAAGRLSIREPTVAVATRHSSSADDPGGRSRA